MEDLWYRIYFCKKGGLFCLWENVGYNFENNNF